MNIDAKTRLCGLIGNPVEHSCSPFIHNTLSQILGINMAYTTFKVEKGEVETAVKGAYALNVLGMNVTVPHKQEVIGGLREIDELAKAIGAVNTLVRVDGGYKGYNTDILGLYRSMVEEGIALEGENVIILGAGGAARAIAFLCADKGAKRVYLLNRTVDKAKEIAQAVNHECGSDVIVPMAMEDYKDIPKESYLCIQTTSVGLHPNDEDVIIADEAFYEMVHTGYDIIYNPYETKFMKMVKAAGGRAFNGLKMLLYQAVAAYELWNDVTVEKEVSDKVFEVLKKEMGIDD